MQTIERLYDCNDREMRIIWGYLFARSGGWCRTAPGTAIMGWRNGMPESRAREAIKRLEKEGFLVVHRTPGTRNMFELLTEPRSEWLNYWPERLLEKRKAIGLAQ